MENKNVGKITFFDWKNGENFGNFIYCRLSQIFFFFGSVNTKSKQIDKL